MRLKSTFMREKLYNEKHLKFPGAGCIKGVRPRINTISDGSSGVHLRHLHQSLGVTNLRCSSGKLQRADYIFMLLALGMRVRRNFKKRHSRPAGAPTPTLGLTSNLCRDLYCARRKGRANAQRNSCSQLQGFVGCRACILSAFLTAACDTFQHIRTPR